MAPVDPPARSAAERIGAMTVTSYAAIGDSLAAGLGDSYGGRSPHDASPQQDDRGFADDLAGFLAERDPEIHYANLAVRGRRVDDILGRQVDEALALTPRPDLVTVSAGGTNVQDARLDLDALEAEYERGVRRLRGAGAEVVLVGIHDPGSMPVVSIGRSRIRRLNERIEAIARRNDCVFVDTFDLPALNSPGAFAADRLHYNTAGALLVAMAVADRIGLPLRSSVRSTGWAEEQPQQLTTSGWFREHALPAVRRTVSGTTSGDGMSGKRPAAAPLDRRVGIVRALARRAVGGPARPGNEADRRDGGILGGRTVHDLAALSIGQVVEILGPSNASDTPAAPESPARDVRPGAGRPRTR